MAACHVGGEFCGDGFANPVMVRLDPIAVTRPGRANEVFRAKCAQNAAIVAPGGGGQNLPRDRMTADGDQREHRTRFRRQTCHAAADHMVQV